MTDLAKLDAQLRAVAPIEGVSIGRWSDKRSWRIDFLPQATTAERAAARAVLDAFDPEAPENAPPPPRDLAAELDALKSENKALRAALVKKGALSEEEIAAEKAGSGKISSSRA
jgi:hypothetical protein